MRALASTGRRARVSTLGRHRLSLKRGLLAASVAWMAASALSASAAPKPKRSEPDPAFMARLAALKKDPAKVIVVRLEPPPKAPAKAKTLDSTVLVASTRTG